MARAVYILLVMAQAVQCFRTPPSTPWVQRIRLRWHISPQLGLRALRGGCGGNDLRGGCGSNRAAPVKIIFSVECPSIAIDGEVGKISIGIIGNVPELGSWSKSKITPLNHIPPKWKVEISMPRHTFLEYKYVRINESGQVIEWEATTHNRRLELAKTNSSVLAVDDGQFGLHLQRRIQSGNADMGGDEQRAAQKEVKTDSGRVVLSNQSDLSGDSSDEPASQVTAAAEAGEAAAAGADAASAAVSTHISPHPTVPMPPSPLLPPRRDVTRPKGQRGGTWLRQLGQRLLQGQGTFRQFGRRQLSWAGAAAGAAAGAGISVTRAVRNTLVSKISPVQSQPPEQLQPSERAQCARASGGGSGASASGSSSSSRHSSLCVSCRVKSTCFLCV